MRKNYWMIVAFVALSVIGMTTSCAQAEDASELSDLLKIDFSPEANDPDAMEVVRPIYKEYTKGYDLSTEDRITAQYVSLQPEAPDNKAIVLYTGSGRPLEFCPPVGCPLFIFQQTEDGTWKNVLHITVHMLFVDTEHTEKGFYDIIVGNTPYEHKKVIWSWDGRAYQRKRMFD